MKAVVIQDLCRGYGSRRGIQDINLAIEEGEIFGFLGPNGSGKSTTIRILMGLLRANSGFANIFGRDCWKDGASLRSDVGYVAGDVRLYPWLTLRRALSILSKIRAREIRIAGLKLADRFQDWAKNLSRWFSVMEYYRPAIIIQTGEFPYRDVGILVVLSAIMWISSGVVFQRRSICTV